MLRSSIWFATILLFGGIFLAPLACGQQEAEEWEEEWEDDEDGEIDPRYRRAQDYHLTGDFAEAFRIYDQILKERPRDVPVLITYGHMHWKIGEYEKAIAKLEKAAEYNPKHIKAKQFLAQLYWHQGDRKNARKVYDSLLALDWIREDVRHSGLIGLGKLALLDGDWSAARKSFRILQKEGNRADRKTGKRGIEMIKRLMKWKTFAHVESKHLRIYFSPSVAKKMDPAARKAYGEKLDVAIEHAVATLGIKMPEPWNFYVFEDDTEAGFYTERRAAYGWDYSWWLSYSAIHSKVPAEHSATAMLVARWAGSRPLSRVLVEGLASWLARVEADPHAGARAIRKRGHLKTMRENQILLRQTDEHETLRCYHHGRSFVAWLIDNHGLEKFGRTWKRFNVTINSPEYKIANTKGIDWERAFSAAFEKGIGEKLTKLESDWRAFLAR